MPGFRRRPPFDEALPNPSANTQATYQPDRWRRTSLRKPAVKIHRDYSIMVVIRLARGGANKRPFYNIVVTDSHNRRDGRFIERLGFYNPMAAGGEQPLRLALDRITYWSGVGAQLSPTVKRLVGQAQKQTAPAAA
jgi:small subunit ribosomal protein S16